MSACRRSPAGKARLLALLAVFLVFVSSCGGGNAVPPVRVAQENPVSNPAVPKVRKGHVYISLSEIGDDIEITGAMVSPLLRKAFTDAGIRLVQSKEEAELVLHGTIRLRLEHTDSRLGLDHNLYGAQADWQLLTGEGYRSLLSRETTAQSKGTGKVEAITRTLTDLSSKIAAEAVPFVKGEFAKR
jgi:hypothetical protein